MHKKWQYAKTQNICIACYMLELNKLRCAFQLISIALYALARPLFSLQLLLFVPSVFSKLPFRLSCNFKYCDLFSSVSAKTRIALKSDTVWLNWMFDQLCANVCACVLQSRFGWNGKHNVSKALCFFSETHSIRGFIRSFHADRIRLLCWQMHIVNARIEFDHLIWVGALHTHTTNGRTK